MIELRKIKKLACPELIPLLEGNEVTYSVLLTILKKPCETIITDYQNILIVYSGCPYPVWIWCRDIDDKEVILAIANCLYDNFKLENGYTYNLSYELLEKLKTTKEYFQKAIITQNMFAYKMGRGNYLNKKCDGHMEIVKMKDLDTLVNLYRDANYEITRRQLSEEDAESRVKSYICKEAMFCWKNESGEIVAIATRMDSDEHSRISAVYTVPGHRRKGYAAQLVSKVSQIIKNDELIPVLYADADYEASNACYVKIGFEKVGSICTVSKNPNYRN